MADPAVFRQVKEGAAAKGRGGGQPQGQVEQRPAPQGEFRRLGKLYPDPQVVYPIGAVVPFQGRGQPLLDRGQLAETILI